MFGTAGSGESSRFVGEGKGRQTTTLFFCRAIAQTWMPKNDPELVNTLEPEVINFGYPRRRSWLITREHSTEVFREYKKQNEILDLGIIRTTVPTQATLELVTECANRNNCV